MSIFKKHTAGFTLVETLVAISIVLIAVASPLAISQRGITSAIYAKEELVASYLAQDALEGMRAKRDENGLAGQYWLSTLDTCSLQNPCIIDTTQSTIQIMPETGEHLSLSESGLYQYGSGNSTPFSRVVYINNDAGVDREALVTVKVSWKSNVLTVSTRLFNIR